MLVKLKSASESELLQSKRLSDAAVVCAGSPQDRCSSDWCQRLYPLLWRQQACLASGSRMLQEGTHSVDPQTRTMRQPDCLWAYSETKQGDQRSWPRLQQLAPAPNGSGSCSAHCIGILLNSSRVKSWPLGSSPGARQVGMAILRANAVLKRSRMLLMLGLQTDTAQSREAAARLRVWGRNGRGDMAAGYRRAQARHNGV
jgi:hypothetical protein